jgi:hypothetical protein
MSKPIARVTLFVLISLALIAATSFSVRGWLSGGTSESVGVQAHTVDGLQTNLNHDRSTVPEVESLQSQNEAQSQPGKGSGHGCESESQTNPSDF